MKTAVFGFVDASTGASIAALTEVYREEETGDLLVNVLEAWQILNGATSLDQCPYLSEELIMSLVEANGEVFFQMVEDFQYGQEH